VGLSRDSDGATALGRPILVAGLATHRATAQPASSGAAVVIENSILIGDLGLVRVLW
jgi:hypothetical protein